MKLSLHQVIQTSSDSQHSQKSHDPSEDWQINVSTTFCGTQFLEMVPTSSFSLLCQKNLLSWDTFINWFLHLLVHNSSTGHFRIIGKAKYPLAKLSPRWKVRIFHSILWKLSQFCWHLYWQSKQLLRRENL